MVVILDLDTVVGVIAHAARGVQRIFAQSILIPQQRKPSIRAPQNLSANAQPAIEPTVGLPSVNDPGLNLQVRRGEDLYAHSVKEPRRIRGDVGGLIGPVVEVV